MDRVVLLDKPKGITSQDAVWLVKMAFHIKKAGHAGTLDPMATGMLIVATGEATKLTRFLMDLEKEYISTFKFGEATDTFDKEGRVTDSIDTSPIDIKEIKKTLEGFKGMIIQKPPAYSAIKRNGVPLYSLARQGIAVETDARMVHIKEILVLGYDFPFLTFKTVCSKGTYIRSLCNDIGIALGTFAHMVELRRTRVGGFTVDRSAKPDKLTAKADAVLTLDEALGHMGKISLSQREYEFMLNGRPVKPESIDLYNEGECLRLHSPEGKFFGIGCVMGGLVRVERLLKI